jgi:protein O-GlcNAc transferase
LHSAARAFVDASKCRDITAQSIHLRIDLAEHTTRHLLYHSVNNELADWVMLANFASPRGAMTVKRVIGSVGRLLQQAVAAHRSGRLQQAETLYHQALRLEPQNFNALHLLGVTCLQAEKLTEARTWSGRALKVNGQNPEAHNNLGMVLSRQGQIAEAIAEFQAAIDLRPDFTNARHNLATAFKRLGRFNEAISHYREAARLCPTNALIHYNLGVALHEQGKLDDAIAAYRAALNANPKYAAAMCNLGGALHQQGQLTEAIGCYERALALDRNYSDAHNNLGVAREYLGQLTEAVACYSEAIRLNPSYAEAYSNLGSALGKQGLEAESISNLTNAVRIKPGFASASYNLGNALLQQGKHSDAIAHYERALQVEPKNSTFFLSYFHTSHQLARWQNDALRDSELDNLVPSLSNPRSPFPTLALSDSADLQKRFAIAFANSEKPLEQIWKARHLSLPRLTKKLRVGYFSADFNNHPVSHLIAEALELHDMSCFDVICYSFGRDDGSAIRKRIEAAATEFHHISTLSAAEIARKIYADQIHILVDLTGYTSGSRSSVLVMRPAPVQVSWLGYPGTSGNPAVDYIIADEFIIPSASEQFYVERVIRLPDTVLPTDRKRVVAEPAPASQYGLPEKAVVFCCFNQTFKILPDMFAAWMNILKAVPGSVLWLSRGQNEEVPANLREQARARGVAPERLVFAARVPGLPEHLARYCVADLALDTYPYTSHTTATDALWAGCPLLTRVGETFASRVAGSLLHAAGLAEMVTFTVEEYCGRAIRLGQTPAELRAIKTKLAGNRDTCALFDTSRFIRNLEAAYQQIWASYCGASAIRTNDHCI